MATITIGAFDGTTDNGNVQNPTRGTLSPDLKTGGAQLDDDDELVIDCEHNDDIELFILDTGGGSVVTVEAGDNPPSLQAPLGAESLTIPDADLLRWVPESMRHVKNDGTIVLTVATGGQVLVWAFRGPEGFQGVSPMNRVRVADIPAAPTD